MFATLVVEPNPDPVHAICAYTPIAICCDVVISYDYARGWASLPSGQPPCTPSSAASPASSAGGAAASGTAGGARATGRAASQPPFPKAMAGLKGLGVRGLMQPRLGVRLDDAGLKLVCARCCPAIIDNISKVLHWTMCICCIMAIAEGPP